jgi:hypothetical protein
VSELADIALKLPDVVSMQRDQIPFTNNNGEQSYNCGSASQRLSQVLFGKRSVLSCPLFSGT